MRLTLVVENQNLEVLVMGRHDARVAGPTYILWRRVVDILRRDDEAGKEYAMNRDLGPLTTGCKFLRRRLRYSRVVSRVDTWTFDCLMRVRINCSSDGISYHYRSRNVGVAKSRI